jgi:anti-sigma factor RsiW
MSCERIEDLLVAYADGELDASARAEVEAHLRSCPACAGLLACLRTASASLAALPELEPAPELRQKLRAIPARKKVFGRALDIFRNPVLQPFMAAASILLTFVSLYAMSPDRAAVNRAVSRFLYRGYSRVEKLYAEAGSVTDSLGEFAKTVYDSLETLNPFKGTGDHP